MHRKRHVASGHALPRGLRFRVLARDDFRCRYCGRPAASPDVVLHVDHVVPRAAGGGDDPANLVTACADCNLGKSNLVLTTSTRAASAADPDSTTSTARVT
jgi:5-methylcytosine-specific restriction endonuclease McrA